MGLTVGKYGKLCESCSRTMIFAPVGTVIFPVRCTYCLKIEQDQAQAAAESAKKPAYLKGL